MAVAQALLIVLLSWISLAAVTKDWCYTEDDCGPLTWSSLGSCNGSRQSPVNITDNLTVLNFNLTAFTFTGYGNASKLIQLSNLGHTVQIDLAEGVGIVGGGLAANYSAIAFHFHWGNGSANPGSEHRLNGKQFPMEMHIVHLKQGLNFTEAKKDPTGIAVLGFLIDVSDSASTAGLLSLSNLLSQVKYNGTVLLLNGSVSIDSLLQGVDRTAYYRYFGSLSTPTCDEAVVWTVFQNPILVPSSLVNAFPSQLYTNASAGRPIVNVFRPLQALGSRQVQTSKATATTAATTTSRGSSLHSSQALALTLALLLAAALKARGVLS